MTGTTSKEAAALWSVAAAAFLMLLKFGVGILSGSLGILAEAMNSLLDIFASLVTFAAVRYADRPADEQHLYGHGKAENLGAFVQSLIMFATLGWIGVEALRRLFVEPEAVRPSIWAFGVMVVSVLVSLWRVRSLRRAAAEHGSQALEADALHFYTDIYTGVAVLVGLGAVWLSTRVDAPFLARADALAALVVVVVLGKMTWELAWHAVDVLLDRSHELTDDIVEAAGAVSGVERVHGVRTRQVGPQSFVDMRIDVARASSFEESHAIATAVEETVHAMLPRADVVVHVDPVRPADESLVQAIHAIARRAGYAIHHITLHSVTGSTVAHLHVELPPLLTLAEAHEHASAFERQVLRELPQLADVISHIEPATEEVAEGMDVTERARSLQAVVERITGEAEEILDCHDLRVQKVGQEYHVSLHCTFEPQANLNEVHESMARLERRLRAEIPALGHVVIHPEPSEERLFTGG